MKFAKNDAVRVKSEVPGSDVEVGAVGIVVDTRRGKIPSYDVRFADPRGMMTGIIAVEEDSLQLADGRKFDDNDVVRLNRDILARGLAVGTTGIVAEVVPGSPFSYMVEFINADGSTMDSTRIEESYLSSLDEAAEPPVEAEAPAEPSYTEPQPSETQAAEPQRPEPVSRPADGFTKGDRIVLETDLPAKGILAGTPGVVTWKNIGPPVTYLVEFAESGGSPGGVAKVEESALLPEN